MQFACAVCFLYTLSSWKLKNSHAILCMRMHINPIVYIHLFQFIHAILLHPSNKINIPTHCDNLWIDVASEWFCSREIYRHFIDVKFARRWHSFSKETVSISIQVMTVYGFLLLHVLFENMSLIVPVRQWSERFVWAMLLFDEWFERYIFTTRECATHKLSRNGLDGYIFSFNICT